MLIVNAVVVKTHVIAESLHTPPPQDPVYSLLLIYCTFVVLVAFFNTSVEIGHLRSAYRKAENVRSGRNNGRRVARLSFRPRT